MLKSWEHRDGRGVSVQTATGWGDPPPVRTPGSRCGRAHPARVSALPETARLGTRFPRAGSGRARLPEPGVHYSRGLPWPLGPSALFLAPCCPCARREAEVLVLRAPGAARAEHRCDRCSLSSGARAPCAAWGGPTQRRLPCGPYEVVARRLPRRCDVGPAREPGKGKRKPRARPVTARTRRLSTAAGSTRACPRLSVPRHLARRNHGHRSPGHRVRVLGLLAEGAHRAQIQGPAAGASGG